MSHALARPLLSSLLVAVSCAAPPPPEPAAAAPSIAASVASAPAPAERRPFESRGGMWMPAQVPLHVAELRGLGLALDPALLADPKSSLLGAIVNLNGCSASFVSREGLVVTNHHCATGALQRNSTPQENLLQAGMLARSRAEERSSGPASRLSVLSSMTEVTERVRPALDKVTDDLLRTLELERLEKEIVAGCERGRPGVRCGFVSLFDGLRYFSIETLELRDIRIVYAPAEGIGNFGGEVDNWRWPRHAGDVTFFRAYVGKDGLPADYAESNVPYQPPAFLKLARQPLGEGDLVFVAGYPGRTALLTPAVEMEEVMTFIYPQRLAMFEAYLAMAEKLAKEDPEVAIKAAGRIRGFNNYRTKHTGELEGMKRAGLLEQKRAEESALQAFIAQDPGRAAAYGTVLSELSQVIAEQRATREADSALEREMLMPRLLSAAYRSLRMAEERRKPDAQRDPAYQERNVPRLRDELKSLTASYSEKFDRATLKLALQRDRARAPSGRTPALELIAGKDATDAAIDVGLAKLYDRTKLGDEKARLALFDGVRPHADPIVRVMEKLYPHLRAVEDRRKRLEGKMLLLKPRFLESLLAYRGGAVAPDANGTLRIAYGTVQRSPEGTPGAGLGAFTKLSELVAKHTGKEPFAAPEKLLRAANSATEVPVNFLSNVPTTNGNSGSATLNARGELVGLLFDGTYESVASDWVFTPSTRSIHVDLRYVLFLLQHVDRAPALLAELGVAP